MKTFRKSGSARERPCLAALPAVALLSLSVPGIRAAAQAPAPCCFTNPAYNGICVVKPGDQETCKSVLEYLNNPNSSGKTYCGGTTIRGGWKEVKCPQTADPKRGRSSLIDPLSGPACRAPGAIPPRAFP
jgi:hypothetical protein